MNAPFPLPLPQGGPAHAVYAPSSAHRWTVCTASAEAIAKLPEQEEGEEAAKGTAAHEELERCLGPLDGAEYNGAQILPVDPDHPAAYAVALAIDYVRKLPAGRIWIERRVRLTDQIWGRCDVCHWDPASRTVTILDLKNGYVDVDAVENEQLQIYAAGSIFTHNLPAEFVRLVVVQPNSFLPVPRVKQWVTTAAALHAFATRVAAIPSDPLTFVAGENCTYCPMFGKCPASRDVLRQLGPAMTLSPDQVRPDQVAIFKAMEKPISDFFKAMDKGQLKAALSGKIPPGMKLVATSKHRAWKDPAAARAVIVAQCGVDALDPPTPAQAEKLGIATDVVASLSDKPEGGPALAFESDKRPAYAPKTTAEMFQNIPGVTAK